MSSDSSDEDILLYLYFQKRKKLTKKRRYWVQPYIERNINCRAFVAARELQQTDEKFLSFYRMSKDSYLDLMKFIAPNIRKRDTKFRQCVSPEERLLITIRYLATGATFVSLGLYFARRDNTIGAIVFETTNIIWNVLKKEYMPIPTMENLMETAERFNLLWNLPNCLGAIDGKHVKIECMPNSGSTNFNYKSYHSIIFMACCDADGIFTMIQSGFAGRNSDGGIFRVSDIKSFIEKYIVPKSLHAKLPYDDTGEEFPFYFVGDEAFLLQRYLMRPYPQRTLDDVKRIYNYRLSRGRRIVECGFGMAAKKFGVLNTPIRCRSPRKVINIINAVCVLHNFVRTKEGTPYIIHPELNERSGVGGSLSHISPKNLHIAPQSSAIDLRNYLANYFIKPQAAISSQWSKILH